MRAKFTGLIFLVMGSLLVWQHFDGGVPAHHFMQRADMPEISNWWGLLLLPAMSWFLLGRVEKRQAGAYSKQIQLGFGGGLLFGLVVAALFTLGLNDTTGNVILGIFAIALFYRVYRAECVLGFVIGMTYTFGAVLPAIFVCFFAAVSTILYHAPRLALRQAKKLAGGPRV